MCFMTTGALLLLLAACHLRAAGFQAFAKKYESYTALKPYCGAGTNNRNQGMEPQWPQQH